MGSGPKGEKFLVLNYGDNTVVGELKFSQNYYYRWFGWIGLSLLITASLATALFAFYNRYFYTRLYTNITRNMPQVAAMVLNRRGKILHANDAFLHMFGFPSDSFKSHHWNRCFNLDSHKPIVDFLKSASIHFGQTEQQLEVAIGNSHINLLAHSYPIVAANVRLGMLVVFGNITQAIQADRMINWALVAHNLAHEMKTPLSTIWFTLERLRQETSGTDILSAHDKHLKSIEEEIRRLDRYVKGFMKLADLNPPNLQENNLNQTLQRLLETYSVKLPETIDVQKDFADDLSNSKLDVNLFTVAITNLLDNAVAAMKGKGTLKVSTYMAQNLKESWVCLAIADTGSGIVKEDIPKIFNPYFSKSDGGSGLGLVITKKIVEDHGGRISFTTREELGTEFVIQLPVPTTSRGEFHA
ncbi:MAG: PAS domain-containing protein [Ignavibacteriae bacterium]|nr:PAS domain-containing protein [Ignavibacteriota bacterium]